MRLIQLSYIGLSLVTLSFFHYQSVGEYGLRLVDYPSINPADDIYRLLLPYMIIFLVLFVCGFTFIVVDIFMVAAKKGRNKGNKRKESCCDSGKRKRWQHQ